jgi:hypothetical protein
MILLDKRSSTPPTPSAGDIRLWINAAGSLCSIDENGTIKVYAEGMTQEQVQDLIGAAIGSTASINGTYDDAGNMIYFTVNPSGVNHDALSNFVANKHVDHSAVSVNAGSGLTGGGDLTATRTISMPDVGTAGTFGSASQVPVITTDAKGRITSIVNTAIAVLAAAISDFAANVRATVLTGFAVGTNTAVVAADSILSAFGKVQAQINAVLGRQIIAGTGLTGGGDLSADRTLSLGSVGTPGTYKSVTTDPQGRVTAGTNPTSLAGYGITDAQPLDADLTALAGLTATGIICRTASNTFEARFIAITNGLSISNPGGVGGNPTLGLANSGVTAGSYGNATNIPTVTVDGLGRVTSASNNPVSIVPFVNSPPPNAAGQFLIWNGFSFVPTTGGWGFDTSVGTSHGQLMQWNVSGSRWNTTVAPTVDGQFLRWSTALGRWNPVELVSNMISDFTSAVSDVITGIISGGGIFDLNGGRIVDAADPVDGQDYTTKAYVDGRTVFGTEAEDFTDATAFSSGSTSNVAAASFTTQSKPEGRYRVGIAFNYTTNSINLSAYFGLYVDGILQGVECLSELKDVTDQLTISYFAYVNLNAGTHTIELRLRNESGLTTTVNRVCSEIWRQS